jgi:hypothetical protein
VIRTLALTYLVTSSGIQPLSFQNHSAFFLEKSPLMSSRKYALRCFASVAAAQTSDTEALNVLEVV